MNANAKQKIVQASSKDGRHLREEYSGRGMFGKTCLAIDCDDPNDVIAEVGVKNAKIDNMGKKWVVYWPGCCPVRLLGEGLPRIAYSTYRSASRPQQPRSD